MMTITQLSGFRKRGPVMSRMGVKVIHGGKGVPATMTMLICMMGVIAGTGTPPAPAAENPWVDAATGVLTIPDGMHAIQVGDGPPPDTITTAWLDRATLTLWAPYAAANRSILVASRTIPPRATDSWVDPDTGVVTVRTTMGDLPTTPATPSTPDTTTPPVVPVTPPPVVTPPVVTPPPVTTPATSVLATDDYSTDPGYSGTYTVAAGLLTLAAGAEVQKRVDLGAAQAAGDTLTLTVATAPAQAATYTISLTAWSWNGTGVTFLGGADGTPGQGSVTLTLPAGTGWVIARIYAPDALQLDKLALSHTKAGGS